MKIVAKIREKLEAALPANSLRRRFAKGAFWSLAGAVISQVLTLTASVVVARLLGKVIFGELGMIRSTIEMFGVFAGLGLGLTATKYVAEFRIKDRARAGRIIGMALRVAVFSGAIMSAGMFFLAPYLASYTINAPRLVPELQIGCALLFLNAVIGVQTGSLAGLESFRTIAASSFFRGLLTFPMMIAGAYLWGLAGVVSGLVAATAAGGIINHILLGIETRKANVPVRYDRLRSHLPVLWKFSLPAVLSSAMVGPVIWTAGAMLVNQPDGYGEMGLFSATNRWRALILFAPGLLSRVVVPILSERLGANDKAKSRKVLLASISANGMIAVPAAIVISLISPLIMSMYGADFRAGWPVLAIVVWTSALLAIQYPVGQVIAASGRMWLGLLMNAGWAAVLLGSFMLLRGKGALGLATSFLVAYIVHAVWTFGFAYAVTKSDAADVEALRKADVPL